MKRYLSVASFILLSTALSASAESYPDFCTPATALSDFTLNGSAASIANPTADCALRLTDDLGQAGSAFLTTPVDPVAIGNEFHTAFTFQITDPQACGDPSADGIAFVITDTPAALGGAGGGIGYYGIANSLAVEFDTWNNSDIGDIDGNHIGINLNGNITSESAVPVTPDMANGEVWYAWIDYAGGTLEVRVSNTSTRPASANLTYSGVTIPGSYVGFTSGTGCAGGDHDILSWNLHVGPPEPVKVEVPLTGIITTKNWVPENDDQAQFKMKEMTGMPAGFCPVGSTVTFSGYEGDGTVNCYCNSKQECVINIRDTELDDAGLATLGEVCLNVPELDTKYCNTGTWTQYDSGSGSWTKYRKDNWQ